MSMPMRRQRSIAFGAVTLAFITGPALADDAKVALAAFRWEGTWSVSCSLPTRMPRDAAFNTKAIRRYHATPQSGDATETSSFQDPDDVNKTASTSIIDGAERVLHMHCYRINEIAATEADEEHAVRSGRLFLLQSFTVMTARRSHGPRPFALSGMAAGETIRYMSVSDGRRLGADGNAVGAIEALERCDGPLS